MIKRIFPILLLLGSTFPAMAHPAQFHADMGRAVQAGFLHPFTGLDHLLVMVAVGLWAVQIASKDARALWMLPCTFVGLMFIGGIAGLSGIHLPIVESGILASIILLGAALGMVWNPTLWIAALFVSMAGLCHGYAHGSEMALGVTPALFLAGMVAATSLLHGLGIWGGLLLRPNRFLPATRLAGAFLLAFAIYDFFTLG